MKKIWIFISLITCSILLTGCLEKVKNEIIDDCVIPDDCVEPMNEDLSTKYFTAFWTEPYWDIEIVDWIAKLSSPMFETEYEEPVVITQEWEIFYIKWEELEGEFIKKDCIDWWKGDVHYYTVSVSKFREYYYEWCWDDEEWIKISDEEYEKIGEWNQRNFEEYEWFLKSCENKISYYFENNISDVSFFWENIINVWKSFKIDWAVMYNENGLFYQKNVECLFQSDDIYDWWEFGNWTLEYWGFLKIDNKSEEELECINSLNQYPPEQMSWDSQTIITVSCYPKDYWYTPWFITWYIYTTTYPDLWLRISTPAGLDLLGWWDVLNNNSIFNNKSEKPIFTRESNKISYKDEYIEAHEKLESESLKDIIEEEYMNSENPNCYVFEYNYYHQYKIFAPYPWTIIYGVWTHSLENEECIKGGEYSMTRFFESPDKTKYYKWDFGDWCAPGPCSIFWEIELF